MTAQNGNPSGNPVKMDCLPSSSRPAPAWGLIDITKLPSYSHGMEQCSPATQPDDLLVQCGASIQPSHVGNLRAEWGDRTGGPTFICIRRGMCSLVRLSMSWREGSLGSTRAWWAAFGKASWMSMHSRVTTISGYLAQYLHRQQDLSEDGFWPILWEPSAFAGSVSNW